MPVLELPVAFAMTIALVAAYTDASKMIIPNWLTFSTIITGVILNVWMVRYDYLTGALVVFGVMFFCWISGWIGGGDMKLAPGLALFLGALPVLYGVALAAAVYALWGALRAWRQSGRFAAFTMVLLGKIPGGAVPLAVLMGPMAVGFRLFFN
ncbi:MAG: hypothetical protein JL56_07285 [Desulfotomaculum sp. BICA1-6]|nr:MAG: hypothetical protein JL56_07285 [Desulfotomaculum sp. BICA1-6]